MYEFIRGKLIAKNPTSAVIETNGIGYLFAIPTSCFDLLGNVDDDVKLLTHLAVREDNWQLYGFADESQRSLFRSVIKVSGIGPKIGLAILSSMSVAEFSQALTNLDSARLEKLPGIGKKTAQRILIELKGSLDFDIPTSKILPDSRAFAEVESALVALGYKMTEAQKAMSGLDYNQNTADLLKQALQQLAR